MATEIEELRAELAELRKVTDSILRGTKLIARHIGAVAQQGATPTGPRVASDSDLDGEWGDKEIRKDPKRWKGDSYAGKRWSEAPPEYLDALAGYLDWMAAKKREDAKAETNEEEAAKLTKYADFDEEDAARVRGWARRKRAAQAPAEEV